MRIFVDGIEFEEEKHPRQSGGKFAQTEGGAKKGQFLSATAARKEAMERRAKGERVQIHKHTAMEEGKLMVYYTVQ